MPAEADSAMASGRPMAMTEPKAISRMTTAPSTPSISRTGLRALGELRHAAAELDLEPRPGARGHRLRAGRRLGTQLLRVASY